MHEKLAFQDNVLQCWWCKKDISKNNNKFFCSTECAIQDYINNYGKEPVKQILEKFDPDTVITSADLKLNI